MTADDVFNDVINILKNVEKKKYKPKKEIKKNILSNLEEDILLSSLPKVKVREGFKPGMRSIHELEKELEEKNPISNILGLENIPEYEQGEETESVSELEKQSEELGKYIEGLKKTVEEIEQKNLEGSQEEQNLKKSYKVEKIKQTDSDIENFIKSLDEIVQGEIEEKQNAAKSLRQKEREERRKKKKKIHVSTAPPLGTFKSEEPPDLSSSDLRVKVIKRASKFSESEGRGLPLNQMKAKILQMLQQRVI